MSNIHMLRILSKSVNAETNNRHRDIDKNVDLLQL
jgi:hypothetical protein